MTVYRTRQETLDDYDGFVEKFKPKRTTDDCYTPPAVYQAVLDWAVAEYGLHGREVVRPFMPGGDYEAFDYPDGCVVIDNPPFSIITPIVRDYEAWGVDYMLFAPYLTNFNIPAPSHLIVGASITYANGAKVDSGFVTNLDTCLARSVPDLRAAIVADEKKTRAESGQKLPCYRYPDELLTANDLGKLARAGIDFKVERGERVRVLDSQRALHKQIYGCGYIIGTKKAELKKAELKKAERECIVFELSERERAVSAAQD